MIDLCFIAPQDRLHRFDELFKELDCNVTLLDADGQVRSLTAFVSRDRAIDQQRYLVLDIGALDTWSEAHVLAALQQLHRFTPATPVLIGQPCDGLDEFFAIVQRKYTVARTLTENSKDRIHDALRSVFSPIKEDKMASRMEVLRRGLAAEAKRAMKPQIPPNFVYRACVAGAMPRCGTTTQAIVLCRYLTAFGFRTAIIDATGKLMEALRRFMLYDETNGVLRCEEITFCQEEIAGYNAFVTDCGLLTAEKMATFCAGDVSVIVGGTKPWERMAFGQAYSLLMGSKCKHLIMLGSFSTPEDKVMLEEFTKRKIGMAPYQPDIWSRTPETGVFEELLSPRLTQICARSKTPQTEERNPEYEPY